MYEIELDYSDLEEVIAKFPEIERIISRRMRNQMDVMLAYLLAKAVDITHSKELVDSGAYVGSLATEVRGAALDLRGTLASSVAHGYYVERGRKPGKFPYLPAIELWARRNLTYNNERELRAAVYLVGRAIADHGTIKRFGYKGGEVMKDTLEEGKPKVLNMWRGMGVKLAKEIERYLTA